MCATRLTASQLNFINALHQRSKRGSRSSPGAPQALRIVHHEKERRQRDPMFASSPAPGVNAGRGHRRGLDGPTMPKPLLKIRMFFSTRQAAGAGRWAGCAGLMKMDSEIG